MTTQGLNREGGNDGVRGRAVLVTGGSHGLGAALGHALTRAGARVVLVARGETDLQATVEAIRAEGGEAHAYVADVADQSSVHGIVGAAQALVGPLDIVVHNASQLGPVPMPLLLDTECEDFSRVLEANLVGPLRITRAVAGGMALRARGLVITVSSDAALSAYPGWGAYGVSKAALDHLMRTFAVEMAATGVRFFAVDPGEMDTRMHAAALPDADRATLARPADVAQKILRMINSATVASGTRIVASEWRA